MSRIAGGCKAQHVARARRRARKTRAQRLDETVKPRAQRRARLRIVDGHTNALVACRVPCNNHSTRPDTGDAMRPALRVSTQYDSVRMLFSSAHIAFRKRDPIAGPAVNLHDGRTEGVRLIP